MNAAWFREPRPCATSRRVKDLRSTAKCSCPRREPSRSRPLRVGPARCAAASGQMQAPGASAESRGGWRRYARLRDAADDRSGRNCHRRLLQRIPGRLRRTNAAPGTAPASDSQRPCFPPRRPHRADGRRRARRCRGRACARRCSAGDRMRADRPGRHRGAQARGRFADRRVGLLARPPPAGDAHGRRRRRRSGRRVSVEALARPGESARRRSQRRADSARPAARSCGRASCSNASAFPA